MVEHYPGTTPEESGGTQAGQVTEQAKQQTQQLAQQAREQAKSQLANQKHDASQRMVPVQSALRETAQQLRKQGQGSIGHYADRAADQVERFSTYLRETEVDEVMDEVRSFARRRPSLFLGSAAAIGFFATRFLKSSSEEQGTSDGDGYSATPTATALPVGSVEGSPTARRTPMAGQPPSERNRTDEPPLGS
jgi:hypothetical protein